MDGRAQGHDFVRIDAAVRFFSENFFYFGLDRRHAGHASDQHDFVDVAFEHFGVFHDFSARFHGFVDEVRYEIFQFRAVQFHDEVLGSARVRGDEREVDFGFVRGGEFDLRFFGRFFKALERHLVVFKVHAARFFEFRDDPFQNHLVKIVAAELRVAVGGQHFEYPFPEF